MSHGDTFDVPLKIAVLRAAGHYVVKLDGAADADSVPALERRLGELRDATAASVIFDFSDLAFISSPGIGAIMSAHRRARERSGTVSIAGANSNVAKMLKLTHIDHIIPLHASVADATAAMLDSPG